MKRMVHVPIRYILFTLAVILIVVSCKEKESEACKDQKRISADFTIAEVVGERDFETDKVMSWSSVRFTANQELESYQWQIGLDTTRYNTRTVELKWFPEGKTIHVQLIGRKASNKECFPDDSGVDTVNKSFLVLPDTASLLLGTYVGSHSYSLHQQDTIMIKRIKQDPGSFFRTAFIGLVDDCQVYGNALGAKAAYIKGDVNYTGVSTCWDFDGYMVLDPDGQTLRIEYSRDDYNTPAPYERIKANFIGLRVP